jgi:hypothetical protein
MMGYIDGAYPSYYGMRQRFPDAHVISITVEGTPGARLADCEGGAMTPGQTAVWDNAEIRAGRRPTNYCSMYYQAVIKQLITTTDVEWFLPSWNGDANVPAGYVGHQYFGGIDQPYDLSVVLSSWIDTPLVDPPPPKPKPPTCRTTDVVGELMQQNFVEMSLDSNGCGAVLLSGGKAHAAGVTEMEPAIPFAQWLAATPQGSNPPANHGYWAWTPHVQEYAGYVLLSITGGMPYGRAGAYVLSAT